MLGAVCALRLAEAGHDVSIFETQKTLGGLTSQNTHGEIPWDKFYHVIEDSDESLLNLLTQLDLTDRLIWRTTNTNFYDGKTLYPLNNAVDYLKLPALNLVDKLRIGFTIVYGATINNGERLESVPLQQWLIKLSGQSGFENLWQPLLRGKLGDNYKIASAAFIWSVIQRFYGARSGVKKTETFGYVQGGYARILENLSVHLERSGVTIITGQRVEQITSHPRIQITSNHATHEFDKVLVAAPSNSISRMCPELSDTNKRSHDELKYQGVICVSMLLEKPLADAYLTYITDENIPFTAVIEMTSLVDPADFGHHHLVYLPKYVPSDHPLFEETDENIEDLFISALQKMFPAMEPAQIVCRKVNRAKYVTTIPTLQYSANKPKIKTNIPGVYICNSAQITNAALSVNESVALGNRTISRLLRDG